MGKNSRDNRPYLRPVTRIELNTGNEKRRWLLAGILLVIGVAAIAFGFSQALSVQPGWEEVIADTQQLSCAPDFKLQYDFTETGGSAASVNKALIQCYSDAAAKAYNLFSTDVESGGENNMAYLNQHVNQEVTVEPELYRALSQVAQSGSRQLFLAPAWVEYRRMFLCENDVEAALYDPEQNEEVGEYLLALAAFVRDPQQISLEMLDENKVCLRVAPEYLAFAGEYGIEVFADFGWMRNAFAADLMADALISAGFTKGYLVSFDGFTRNLDTGGGEFTQNFFDRQGSDVFLPARMHYAGQMSIVTLRDYAMSDRDRWHYYHFESGRTVTTFLDPQDARSKSAVPDLMAYSREKGCGEILLELADVFIADSFQPEALLALTQEDLFSIWPEGKVLCYTDPSLNLEMLSDSGPGYSKLHR